MRENQVTHISMLICELPGSMSKIKTPLLDNYTIEQFFEHRLNPGMFQWLFVELDLPISNLLSNFKYNFTFEKYWEFSIFVFFGKGEYFLKS